MTRVVRSKRSNPEVAEKRATVMELRNRGWTFDQIGNQLGVSAKRAHTIYQEALDEYPVPHIDEHRQRQMALMNAAVRELLEIARDPETSPRTRVEAWNSLKGWSDAERKMLGIDVPERHVHMTLEDALRETERLIIEEEAKLNARAIESGLPQRG